MRNIKKTKKASEEKTSGRLLSFLEKARAAGGSKLTVVGTGKLCLEGGGEIVEYQSDRLKIALKKGFLTVTGEQLEIVAASDEDLLLQGTIRKIEFS